MSSINVDDNTKERFNDLQPDDMTQDEFTQELLNSYEQHGKGIDPSNWVNYVVEGLAEPVATKAELGAYRGAKEGANKHD